MDAAHGSCTRKYYRPRRRGGYQPPVQLRCWSVCGKRTRTYLRRRGRWSGLPLSLPGPHCGPPRQAAAQPLRSLHLPQAALPCRPHRPEPNPGGSQRRRHSGVRAGGRLIAAPTASPPSWLRHTPPLKPCGRSGRLWPVRSTQALRHRRQADARCAPLRCIARCSVYRRTLTPRHSQCSEIHF